MSSLKVQNLSLKVADFILKADFQIHEGSRTVLMGRSGSGKTTLLRWMAGLEQLGPGDTGSLYLGSQDLTQLPPQKREAGVIFQEFSLFPELSVLENATFALRIRGMSFEKRKALAQPWLEKVDLWRFADQEVSCLSGGESQRVAFVRALIWKPKFLLLDEPFSALDTQLRKRMRKELIELHQLWPVPLLMVTHDEVDRDELATQTLLLTDQAGVNENRKAERIILSV